MSSIHSQTNSFDFVNNYLGDYPHFRNSDILFGLWRIPKTDLERAICERFYGKEARRKLENYVDHLIKKGATKQDVEKIYAQYDLEYKMALENGQMQN